MPAENSLADAGTSPRAVLAAATHRAAAALGLGSVTGRLAEGPAADAVAVPGNPTEDLIAPHRPRQVIAQGRTFECATPSEADRAERRVAAQHIHDELTVGSGRGR